MSAERIRNKKIEAFAFNLSAAVFYVKISAAPQDGVNGSPVPRPVRNEFDLRSEFKRRIRGHGTPMYFLAACETAVPVLCNVDTDRAVIIRRHGIKMAPPGNVINTPQRDDEKKIGKDRALDAREKRGGMLAQFMELN